MRWLAMMDGVRSGSAIRQGVVGLVIAVAIGLLATGVAATPESKAAVVVVLALGLWATGALPEWLTALLFMTLCIVAGVAPPDVTLAGFTSSAVWLVISGIVIGAAIRHTGLGDRLAGRVAPLVRGSYPRTIVGVVLFGLAMVFVMPSAMGRIVLMLPILRALVGHLGYREGSRRGTGVLLAGVLGTFMPAFTVLPANVPNNVFVGTVEALIGAAPPYGGYLLLHFPILGALKTLVLMAVLILLYRDRRNPEPLPSGPAASEVSSSAGAMSGPERHLLVVLLIAVVLWATDTWHGLSPAWVGMMVAVWCLFPGTGLLKPRPMQGMSFEPAFYVAGIVGLGLIVHQSGLGDRVAAALLSVLPLTPDADARTFGLLSGVAALLGTVVTQPGVPAVETSLAPALAEAAHWPLQATLMTQVVGFSTVFLPYQAPPLVVAMQMGGFPKRDMVILCLVMAALSITVLWPLDYLWWQVLGMMGT